MRIKLIGRYVARSDNGQTYGIKELQEFVEANTKDGNDEIPGMRYFELNDGSKLNHIDERTWEIVSNGTILKRLR